jgi:hypothetical protein
MMLGSGVEKMQIVYRSNTLIIEEEKCNLIL